MGSWFGHIVKKGPSEEVNFEPARKDQKRAGSRRGRRGRGGGSQSGRAWGAEWRLPLGLLENP